MPAIYHEGSWLGNATDPEVLVKDTVGWTGKNRAFSQTNNAVIAHIENGITYDVSWTGSATITLKKNSASGATITSGSTSPLSFTADADYELYFGSSTTVTNIMVKDSRITDPTYEPYHESVEEEIEQIYADNGVLGAKNFLCDYAPTTITSNGITWTRDENGVITANGTTTDASYYELWSQNPKVSEGYKNLLDLSQTYILNGNSQVWSDEWYVSLFMRVHLTDNSDRYFFDNGNGVVINLSQFNNIGYITMYCRVGYVQHGAQTVSNYKIRPMLRLASDPDDTYVPPAMTNRELTEDRYYHAGDTVNVSLFNFSALCTNSSKDIRCTIPLSKDVSRVSNFTFKNTTTVSTRKPAGGYVIDGLLNTYTVTRLNMKDNFISFKITKTDDSAFDAPNNCCLDLAFTGGSNDSIITFS